jgi:hypothetical protein
MKIHSSEERINPPPSPRVARTTAALLSTIATALNGDGSAVVPGSIDSQGMSIEASGWRWRLELSEPELMDWFEGDQPTPPMPEVDQRERDRDYAERRDRDDYRDWMADCGSDIEF